MFISDLRNDITLTGVVNNISFTFPSFPPLTQPELVDESLFCDNGHLPENCVSDKICYCINRLKIKLNSIVELIIVDEAKGNLSSNRKFRMR